MTKGRKLQKYHLSLLINILSLFIVLYNSSFAVYSAISRSSGLKFLECNSMHTNQNKGVES